MGTGFHPELTGRENIFLNGAILGISRAEIKKHFDAIVDFAETEKFLDTPVKRYSSGMYVRLAFAVAAHLDPEILVVDEVLAVGDAQFQKKCLGKMEEVSINEGRTLLFVSHNLATLQNLCNKGILLSNGMLTFQGDIGEAANRYINEQRVSSAEKTYDLSKELLLKKISLSNSIIKQGSGFTLNLELLTLKEVRIVGFAILFYNIYGIRVGIIDCRGYVDRRYVLNEELNISIDINNINLIEGYYTIGIYLHTLDKAKNYLEIAEFNVESGDKIINYAPYESAYRF